MKEFFQNKWKMTAIFILCLIAIDLLIKYLVLSSMPNITIIENGLRIVTVENAGSAGGYENQSIWQTILTNVVVLVIIFKYLYMQKESINKKTLFALSLILSGGISNLLERIICGKVTDYIQIFPQSNFPIFNLADIWIVTGWIIFAAILAYRTGRIRTKKEYREELLEEINKKNEEKRWKSSKQKKREFELIDILQKKNQNCLEA